MVIFNILILILLLSFSFQLVGVFANTHNLKASKIKKQLFDRQHVVKYASLMKNDDLELQLSFIDKLHIKYIERSGIRLKFPFFSIYWLFSINLITFVGVFYKFMPYLSNIITASIVAGLISYLPYIFLDLMGNFQSEKVRSEITAYTTSLRTWSNVNSDIVYIFEKASEDTKGMLGVHGKEMVMQIRNGLQPELGMNIMKVKVGNPYFDTFMLNISHAFSNTGDLIKLLYKLEREAFKLEQAFEKRKYRTLHDRIIIFGLMLTTLGIALNLIMFNEVIRNIYINTLGGQIVLTIVMGCFATGVYKMFKITEFNH